VRRFLGLLLLVALPAAGQETAAAARRLDTTAVRLDGATSAGFSLFGTGVSGRLAAWTGTSTLGGALGSSVTAGTGAITLTSQGAAVTPLTIVPHASQTAPLILFGADTGLARARAGLLKATSGGSNLGSVQAGNFTATALGTPTITSPLTVNGTPGATTYGYKAVAFLNDGTSSAASAEVTVATGPATLDGTDNITVATPAVANMAYYNLYRTTGGAAPPKLIYSGTTPSYIDTGTEISASTPPTTNTTGRILVGAGGVSTPSLALGSTPTTGIYWPSATNMTMVVGGSSVFSYGTVLHQMAHDVGLGWSADPVWALADTLLTSPAAATLTVGNKPSATPAANTLIVGESGSGTDIAGANGIIQSGTGTGSGAGSTLTFKTPTAGGSGSGAQTQTTRLVLGPTGITTGLANNVEAFGAYAAASNSGTNLTATGYYAAASNSGNNVAASGAYAASANTGASVTANGYQAASANTGNNVAASGAYAASANTGNNVAASGAYAASANTGASVTANGYQAAYLNTGGYVAASGAYAASANTGDNVAASGAYAAYQNTGASVTASGASAAYGNTGANVTASGYQAAYQNSGANVTASGYQSGQSLGIYGRFAPLNGTWAAAKVGSGALALARTYRILFTLDGVDTELSTTALTVAAGTASASIDHTGIPVYSGPKTCTARKLYKQKTTDKLYYLVTTIADNVTTVYSDTQADATYGTVAATPANTAAYGANATTWGANEMAIGGSANPIDNIYLGGQYHLTPATAGRSVTVRSMGANGTDLAGGDLTVGPGAGTGAGTASSFIVSTPTVGGSGASAQTQATRLAANANGVTSYMNVLPSSSDAVNLGSAAALWGAQHVARATLGGKSKATVDATPTAFATIPLADGAATGGKLIYRVVVTSGTSRQVVSGSINYAAARDGATYAVDYDEIQQSTAVTTGTLTGSVTCAGAADLLTFSADFDSSLDVAGTIYYRFDSTDTLAPTPL